MAILAIRIAARQGGPAAKQLDACSTESDLRLPWAGQSERNYSQGRGQRAVPDAAPNPTAPLCKSDEIALLSPS
jgi:hypothetical protein